MVLGIPHWLTKAEQGYYFTFSSLIAMQVFFELGFNYVITQLAGHETAHLKKGDDGRWYGPENHLGRMASILMLIHRWYRVIAFLFCLIVTALGYWFFERNAVEAVPNWELAWIALVVFTAGNLYLSPFLAVAEGMGTVATVALVRLKQSLFGYLLLWLLLSLGVGLVAMPVVAIAAFCFTAFWFFRARRQTINFDEHIQDQFNINWRTEIFPFQWRIAVSWISGYFIFQLFNPIIFASQGAIAAGKAGLALSVFGTLLSVPMSWVTAKAPAMVNLIAQGNHVAAKQLFWRVYIRSALLCLLGCLLVILLTWLAKASGLPIGDRVLDLPSMVCLAVVTQTNHLIFSMAAYMRAHKKEPLLASSVVVGLLVAMAVYLTSKIGVFHIMASYMGITLFIALPWCALIFRKFL